MSLQDKLATRLVGRPIRVGLIGAGKFGSMFLSQVPAIAGIEVAVIADLDPERARQACRTVGGSRLSPRARVPNRSYRIFYASQQLKALVSRQLQRKLSVDSGY